MVRSRRSAGSVSGSFWTRRSAAVESAIRRPRWASRTPATSESRYRWGGRPLDGSKRYTVTFSELPPVKGFWSITLYDQFHFLAPNALNRFSLGTKSEGLRFEPDGSLVIYVQKERPEADKVANWLPAPDGAFSLYIRAYWLLPPMQQGRWTPPPVVPVPQD